jgi:cytochrome c553
MRRNLVMLAVAGSMFLGTASVFADASGRTVGVTCNGCHGTDGVSVNSAPSLKGLPHDHLKKSMMDFKSGARPSSIMGRIAKGYTDNEIDAVAKYFSDMK